MSRNSLARAKGAWVRPSSRPKALLRAMRRGYDPIGAHKIDLRKAEMRHRRKRPAKITALEISPDTLALIAEMSR